MFGQMSGLVSASFKRKVEWGKKLCWLVLQHGIVGNFLWTKSKNNSACPIRMLKHLQPFINQKHTADSSTCPATHTFTHTSPPSLWYRLRSPMKPGCVTQPDYAPLPHYPASPRVPCAALAGAHYTLMNIS